jgi:3-dehydroquinate synthase
VDGVVFVACEFEVVTSHSSYSVVVESGSASKTLDSAALVVIDEYVHANVLPSPCAATVVVPGNETTKTLASCEDILRRMNELGARRGDVLVAVGGGAIQDAATLVASLYMRGLSWVYCPSTAMAMADSCLGGKSSINVAGIKNLVGNIYPPQRVVIDPALAIGLSTEAKISGLAEAVKICFAAGEDSFARYLDRAIGPEDFGRGTATELLLLHVLEAKKWFIEVDEFDARERQLLNFGHTYAHAIEAATDFSLPHGIAVALGVLGALEHPLSAHTNATIKLHDYVIDLLKPIRPRLESLSTIDWTAFERAVVSDKKATRDHLRLVLPSRRGSVEIASLAWAGGAVQSVTTSMGRALEEVTA